MRVIVRCAGPGERWNDYRGVPKHLAPICGEAVLTRTVRLIGEIAPDADVVVAVANIGDRRYLEAVKAAGNPRAKRSAVTIDESLGDLDKLVSSVQFADPAGATVVMFGDVWWSRPALEQVLGSAKLGDEPGAAFLETTLRVGAHGGGEIFAFSWGALTTPSVAGVLDRCVAAQTAGDLDAAGYEGAPLRGGWAFYRAWHDAGWTETGILSDATTHVVDDWTEDFDEPDDWDRWCYRWAKASPADRAAQV